MTDSTVTLRGSNADALSLSLSNTSPNGKTLTIRIEHLSFPSQTMGSIPLMTLQATNGSPIEIEYLETTGDVRDIVGSRIVEARVGGNLGDGAGSGAALFDPVVSASGSVESLIVDGDFEGDVLVAGGGVDFLQVLGANGIGALSDEATIGTRDAIQHVDVPNGAIWADIYAGGYAGGANPDIGRIFAKYGIHQKSSTGITCRKIDGFAGLTDNPGIYTTGDGTTPGDLDCNVTLSEALKHPISIGGSFTSGHTISVPSISSVTGQVPTQITFNTLGGSNDWDGDIKIGGTSLTGQPYYTNTASSIGGGSAGLATFHQHLSSCSPPNGAEVSIYGPTVTCIEDCCDHPFTRAVVRLYGPAQFASGVSPPHFLIEKHDDTSGMMLPVGWSSSAIATILSDHREIEIKRPSNAAWGTGLYRISPIDGHVKCEGVTGTPDVEDFQYYFTLYTDCSYDGFAAVYDQNQDDVFDAADLRAWARAPRDVNGDGVADAADLNKLMTALAR